MIVTATYSGRVRQVALALVAPGFYLADEMAAAVVRCIAEGMPAAFTETFRTAETQGRRRQTYLNGGPFALPVGYSKHEIGEAMDVKRAAADWLDAHPESGMRRTNSDEWWHYELFPALIAWPAPEVPTVDVPKDDDAMITIHQNTRGIALVGPGYSRHLSPSWWKSVERIGYPAVQLPDTDDGIRDFDQIVAAHTQPTASAVDTVTRFVRQVAAKLGVTLT